MVVKRLRDTEDLPFFNLRDHDAVVDGTTNDSAAVLSALTAAKAMGGGVIHFPRGTTRITSTVSIDMDAGTKRGLYILQGEGGASKIKFTGLGANYGISIANANLVKYRDLAIVGSTSGSGSGSDFDTEYAIIFTTFVDRTIYENVVFAGLGSEGDVGAFGGIISNYSGHIALRDCIFGACTSTASGSGVVHAYETLGVQTDNVWFVDYLQLDDIIYNKLSLAGNTNSWIKTTAPQAMLSGTHSPDIVSLRNTYFDENTVSALVDVVGTSERSARLENVGFSGGFGLKPSFKFNTFRKVTFRDVFNGLSLNTTDFESGQFTDVGLVDIDNLLHKYGAKYITLAGTTGKLLIRNSRLQGNGTHPTGVNNTAGATVDASPALPNQL